jgi:hypothetical protein
LSPAAGQWKTPDNSIALNQWYHVLLLYNISSDTNDPIIYINGVKQAVTEFQAPGGTPTDDAGTTMAIGNVAANVNRGFDGTIDDVRVYNRELSVSEVKQLYNLGSTKVNASSQTLTNGSTLKDGLVGLWTFDGPDVTDKVYDRSGSANNGYYFNAATSSAKVFGKLGQALSFDGTNDYVGVPDATSLHITSAITLSAWVKSVSNGDYQQIITKPFQDGNHTSPYFAYQLAVNPDSTIRFGLSIGGSLIQLNTGQVTYGAWTHLAATYDGSTMILYKNGVQIGSSAQSGAFDSYNTALRIGTNGGNGESFLGSIDDPRVYNRALSASEVKQLYNIGR